MILTCEECQTRYLVPGHSIGSEGRRVRCTNCGHEWFVAPEEDAEDFEEPEDLEPIPESVRPMPEGSELPVISGFTGGEQVSELARWAGYGGALGVFILVFGLLVALHGPLAKAWPASAGLYSMLGMQTHIDGEGLIFDNITAAVNVNDDGMDVLSLKGTVMNLKPEDSPLPEVQASLIGKDGEVIDRWLVDTAENTVKANSQIGFTSSYPEIPKSVHEVNVRFLAGNIDMPEEGSSSP